MKEKKSIAFFTNSELVFFATFDLQKQELKKCL